MSHYRQITRIIGILVELGQNFSNEFGLFPQNNLSI